MATIFKNKDIFNYYVQVCNDKYRSGHDLSLYREIIDRHKGHNGLSAFLNDETIYPLIIKTLRAWNMDQRGARLTTIDKFKQSVSCRNQDLLKLSLYKLHSIDEDEIYDEIIALLRNVFMNLKVMESKRRLVGVSKAMHFILPDLIMPIDNKYTLTFFNLSSNINKEWDHFETIFWEIFSLTRQLCLTQEDVNGEGWNTSVPKIIDNAIIDGFVKSRLLLII